MPHQDGRIAALADRCYGRLLQAGEQGLSINPLVDLSAPAQGEVLWSCGRELEGYRVTKLDRDSVFPEDSANFERIGFSAAAQQDGVWVLMGVRYAHAQATWAEQARSSHAFAHYDPMAGCWTVVRLKPGAARDGDWTAQWLPAGNRLGDEEKSVIARIAGETAMLLDAAVTLQDDPSAYPELENILMRQARESADPGDIRRMGAVFRPYEYLAMPIAHRFRVSAFGKLESLAKPLYRALAGKAQRDSGGLMAVATVSEATLCPPHEPDDRGLSRATRPLAPPPSRPPHPRRPPRGRPGGKPGQAAGR
jgi:hypothetical protein